MELNYEQELRELQQMASRVDYDHQTGQSFLKKLRNLLSDDYSRTQATTILENYVNQLPDFANNPLATFILSIYDKFLPNHKTLLLSKKIIQDAPRKTPYALNVFLRVCQRVNNYTEADHLFASSPSLLKLNTLEVLYQLVAYYGYKNDFVKIKDTIRILIIGFKKNLLVQKIAKSLAIQYGCYSDFERIIEENLALLTEKPDSFSEQLISIEQAENEKKQAKLTEQARTAIEFADLTKGISHEFGQALTNIRFSLQYRSKQFEKKPQLLTLQNILECFDDVLKQTKRMGELTSSLDPVTSTKATITNFNLKEAFDKVIGENSRINTLEVNVRQFIDEALDIVFNPVQFNQIFTNLLINSLDSIEEKKQTNPNLVGRITIGVKLIGENYSIHFSDNGKGIDANDQNRIFNAFYTTKPPGRGQGLGLYIISKLLRANGGSIELDRDYTNGAKFKILIPKNHGLSHFNH